MFDGMAGRGPTSDGNESSQLYTTRLSGRYWLSEISVPHTTFNKDDYQDYESSCEDEDSYFDEELSQGEEDSELSGSHGATDESDFDEYFSLKKSLRVRKPRIGTRQSRRLASGPRRLSRKDGSLHYSDDQDLQMSGSDHIGPEMPRREMQATFKVFSKDHAFKRCHQGTCERCGEASREDRSEHLIGCIGCSTSWHKSCLGDRATTTHLVIRVASTEWVLQCRYCMKNSDAQDPSSRNLGRCQECQKPGLRCNPIRQRLTNKEETELRQANDGADPIFEASGNLYDANEILFRCTACKRAYHQTHSLDFNWEASLCSDCRHITADPEKPIAWRFAQGRDGEPRDPGTCAEVNLSDKEYLIKWKDLPYRLCSWISGTWAHGRLIPMSLRSFAENDRRESLYRKSISDAIPEDYHLIDVIMDIRYDHFQGGRTPRSHADYLKSLDRITEVFAKYRGSGPDVFFWDTPPERESSRWPAFKAAFDEFVLGKLTQMPEPVALRRRLQAARLKDFEASWLQDRQPDLLGSDVLRLKNYQQTGHDWLYYHWFHKQNAILADEMGLGKTIQIIAVISTLVAKHQCWPFLIVVPNATCPNWRREFRTWAPALKTVLYYGSGKARKAQRDYELFKDSSSRNADLKCHVLITSYETATTEIKIFQGIAWQGLVVDEGQRLKNDQSLLYKNLSSVRAPFKILMTGTPLQNNIKELFNLLEFLEPAEWNADDLEKEYADLRTDGSKVTALREMIKPCFLRRTKVEVLKELPDLVEVIVPLSMTSLQEELYKAVIASNANLVRALIEARRLRPTEKTNLNNVLVQVRKIACHPFVYTQELHHSDYDPVKMYGDLISASAKTNFLAIMLPKLRERGHRILLFSQFLDMLNVMEDFLDQIGVLYTRIDGNVNAQEKQKRIDAFNAPDSPLSACLLSTRAGGVGINLASANVVIILDPDWNPHQDLQAIARAHRIGQDKKVMVFKLMTERSAEEKIFHMAKAKLSLDHVIIEQMEAKHQDPKDIESILSFGAMDLFSQQKDLDGNPIRKEKRVYDSDAVDLLLNSTEQMESQVEIKGDNTFAFAKIWETRTNNLNSKQSLESNDGQDSMGPGSQTDLWRRILDDPAVKAAAQAKSTQVVGKRKRKNISYEPYLQNSVKDKTTDHGNVDQAYTPDRDDDTVDDEELDPQISGSEATDRKKRSRVSTPILGTQAPAKSHIVVPQPQPRVREPQRLPDSRIPSSQSNVQSPRSASMMNLPIGRPSPNRQGLNIKTEKDTASIPTIATSTAEHCLFCRTTPRHHPCPKLPWQDWEALSKLRSQIKVWIESAALSEHANFRSATQVLTVRIGALRQAERRRAAKQLAVQGMMPVGQTEWQAEMTSRVPVEKMASKVPIEKIDTQVPKPTAGRRVFVDRASYDADA